MKTYKRHRFPPDIISYAVWLYHRFNLSNRDVEDLLAEQGINVSYETIRLWCIKFGSRYARRLKQRFLSVHAAVYNLFNLGSPFGQSLLGVIKGSDPVGTDKLRVPTT